MRAGWREALVYLAVVVGVLVVLPVVAFVIEAVLRG